MPETLTFPTLRRQQQQQQEEEGSPPRFTFPELVHYTDHQHQSTCCSELSSSTCTPFVSAPSSPTRSKGFYFSAPTSPSGPPCLHEPQGFDFPFWRPPISSSPPQYICPLHTQHHGCTPAQAALPLCKDESTLHTLPCSAQVKTERVGSPQSSLYTEHHGSSYGFHQADHTRSSPSWAQRSLQAEPKSRRSSWSQKALQSTQKDRTAPPSLHTEYERSPNHSLETEDQQRSLQKDLRTKHVRSPLGSHAPPHTTHSNLSPRPKPIIADFASHKTLKRLQVDDTDASYSRKGFYASAVPFSWEEKPGTPKARSITSEASNDEDDSPSNLLSGSSEFEFSARFFEVEETPMSPTPISSPFNSFKHQYAHGSPSPTHKHLSLYNPDVQSETVIEEQIWPLRPPPRLEHPALRKQPDGNELKGSYGSLSSLSAPQSPQSPPSPRIFDIKRALCGISSPVDAVFDPFLAAMEKSMTKSSDEEMGKKSPKKRTDRYSHGRHRRTQSFSPLRVFHWDDHSAKSNSSSNGSSSMDEVKNKHPIQREINARHSAGTPKGLKRWSFKGLLHRKSISGGETARHSNTSASLRSSGRESCSSSGTGEGLMDVSSVDDNVKIRGANSPSMVASMPSTPSSTLSPSSSNNSSRGRLNTNKSSKGAYAFHYGMQRAHTEELRKKTFLPYKQGLLGCLGLSSKSYRALASLSKPLQPVS